MSKKIRPKIRKVSIEVPICFLEIHEIESEIELPKSLLELVIVPKYYKVLKIEVKDTEDYEYTDIEFTLEKLQNLKSYTQ